MKAPILILFAARFILFAPLFATDPGTSDPNARKRAREHGITPGVLAPGPLNAITDVAGVRVGHVTLREGDSIRTGVTAILPHGGNLFREKVPGGKPQNIIFT